MKSIAAYTKLSGSDQNESVEMHLKFFKGLLDKREDCELVEFYAEEVRTRNSTGVAFERMMKDAEQHKFDYLLIKSVSRLSRNAADALSIIKRLKDQGIVVYFVQEKVSSEDENFKILMELLERTKELELMLGDIEKAAEDEAYEASLPLDEE